MAKYIERDEAIAALNKVRDDQRVFKYATASDFLSARDAIERAIKVLERLPAADVEPVKPGRWELTVHSFYYDTFDESCELCVYIVANCSECSGKHPDSYQVFNKTIYAPEDAGDDFRFDKKEEENKALQEFQSRNYHFAYYCPNCGARMVRGHNNGR